jgi:DNA-binding transcriptional ArsR family regulator
MSSPNIRLTDLQALNQAAECLRTLAHPHRLRMLQMLLQRDFPVGELAQACEIPSAMASEHLRLMQRCGFLISEKSGRNVFYRVADDHLANILQCVESRFGVCVTTLPAPECPDPPGRPGPPV